MKVTATIVFVFGLLIALGGIMGFVKSGSQASLISGSAFGIALLISGYLISKGKIIGQYTSFGLDLLARWVFHLSLCQNSAFLSCRVFKHSM